MATEQQFTAKTGLCIISTANPNLDGTGVINSLNQIVSKVIIHNLED